jgi:uncharacterized membrane protein YczE
MDLTRRLPQYFLGLVLMALGVVLIKKADIGISPLSAIPAAVSNITPFTLGNTTIAFHFVCVLLQIILRGRITVKAALTLPLAVAFGYIIDLFMLLPLGAMSLPMKCLVCLAGIAFTALGIVTIVGADLMLPAPDAFLRQASEKFGKPLSTVKVIGDVTWVAITLAIELIASHRVVSIGIGTVVSMLLTGKLVGVFNRLMPWLRMKPTSFDRK